MDSKYGSSLGEWCSSELVGVGLWKYINIYIYIFYDDEPFQGRATLCNYS